MCEGTSIQTFKEGHIEFGDKIHIGPNNIICSEKQIKFGNQINMSWFVQIYDTDFHYAIHEGGNIYPKNKPISIGDHVWIGHHVTINKGAVIPSNSVIAAGSLVNKDLRNCGEGLFGGMPAKFIKSSVARIFDNKQQKKIDNVFKADIPYTNISAENIAPMVPS